MAKHKVTLTPGEEKFCQNYSNGMSPLDAYNDAFDKPEGHRQHGDARKLLDTPAIKSRIDGLLKDRNREFFADKKFVLDNLKAIVAKNGLSSKLSLDALNLIGKEIGMFVTKIETNDSEQHSKATQDIWKKRMEIEKAANPEKTLPFAETRLLDQSS
jgi:hypothetical protein